MRQWTLVLLWCYWIFDHATSLRWRHNGRDSVWNHQPHDCFLNRLFRRRSQKTSKVSVTGLCAGNSPGTGELPAQMASNAENISIWWCHHVAGSFWGSDLPRIGDKLRTDVLQLILLVNKNYGQDISLYYIISIIMTPKANLMAMLLFFFGFFLFACIHVCRCVARFRRHL